MSTAVNDPDFNTQAPIAVLESFFNTHTTDEVKLTLLETLQGYALNENKGFLKLEISEEQITIMFDSLIALVGAVEMLMEEGKIVGLKS